MLARANVKQLPLADESIDLIFTDPPYAKDALPCYEWLANEAARVLRPGGFVLAMCGGNYNGPIHKMFLDAGLQCFFDIAVPMENGRSSAYLFHIGVNVRSKFILSYSKGPGCLAVAGMHNMYIGRRDKRFHHWGQDVDHARYFIEHFTKPGDLICDPMIGGGTTGIACQLVGRRFIGMDIDPDALRISSARLANSDAAVNLPLFSEIYDANPPE